MSSDLTTRKILMASANFKFMLGLIVNSLYLSSETHNGVKVCNARSKRGKFDFCEGPFFKKLRTLGRKQDHKNEAIFKLLY